MKIKRPKQIPVGGHWYEVVLERGYALHHHRRGEVNFETQTITIEKDLSSGLKTVTLYHEIEHCINHTWMNSKFGEDEIDSMAEGWYQVLCSWGLEIDWEE